ncbi:MAG: hypothetical protein SFV32_08980 [Opitutaceae bacterium]|nr:hypothetical protein [Opitutaceae bacterium]
MRENVRQVLRSLGSSPLSLRWMLVALALLTTAILAADGISRTFAIRPEKLSFEVQGAVARNGQYWSVPEPRGFPRPRFWGTWSGEDSNTGRLKLGPFRAGPTVNLFVSGYPNQPGITLQLVRLDNGETHSLLPPDAGEQWVLQKFKLPESWRGKEVLLLLDDRAEQWKGWVGISEPVTVFFGSNLARHLLLTLTTFAAAGPAFMLALALVRGCDWVSPHWHYLCAAALVLLVAYCVFWVMFLSAPIGKTLVVALWLASLFCLGRLKDIFQIAPEVRTLSRLSLGVVVFHLSLLAWYISDADFAVLAQNRYVPALPGDNSLPGEFARLLLDGKQAVNLGTDWLTSDRPPLQTAFLMLVLPWTDWLGLPSTDAAGIAGVWLQVLWVPACYGVLRELGVPRNRCILAVAALGATGFTALNTVFVWPKLLAGALGLGVFGLWILSPRRLERAQVVLGGLLAVLAWLSHGGIAFSLLALAPWVLWRIRAGPARPWLGAFVVALAVFVPWFAFQKLYAPPANRLLKWHLAGQVEIDARPFGQTLLESYAAKPWRDHLQGKEYNLGMQFGHRWADAWPSLSPNLVERRHNEFFFTARAVGLWLLGIPVLAALFLFRRSSMNLQATAHLFVWTIASYLVWCALLFQGGQAVIHQGSYASILGIFLLCAAGLARLPHWAFVSFIALQTLYFITTWWTVQGSVATVVNPLCLLVLLALGFLVTRGTLGEGRIRRIREAP